MTSAVQKIVTPGGETMVVVPEADYEALLDAADIADANRVLAEIAAGRQEWVPSEIVDRLLDGENRVRVWREYRGLTAADLAAKAGISKLADVLKLDIDDLVA